MTQEPTLTLFRPVGQKEMERIQESGFQAFPPWLAHQPIFYPVLNEQYAVQIARDWNTRDEASGFVGYVTASASPPPSRNGTRSGRWAAPGTRSYGSRRRNWKSSIGRSSAGSR
jgi:hypothetical protein